MPDPLAEQIDRQEVRASQTVAPKSGLTGWLLFCLIVALYVLATLFIFSLAWEARTR
jgi:hypothetical protein